jgi:penicillin G amidase
MEMRALLQALREHPTWEEVASALSCTVDEARAAVDALLRSQVPPPEGEVIAPEVSARIVRDAWGVPHISGGSAADAYFGLGFAMAQDRLWQMDYLRRAAGGTLAEVLGEGRIEEDRLARTLGLGRAAEACAAELSGQDLEHLEYFCGGVNMARALAERDGLPFEFELLEYAPEPWTPADTLLVLRGFWWYLSGRFPVICVPEYARHTLGEGPLFEAFLAPEGDEATVWPRSLPYPDLPRWSGGRPENTGNPPTESGTAGSNNWVVAPSRSASRSPLLASDPHIPFFLPSVWYEARLQGGELDACGAFCAGAPGIFFGRNRDVAWGLTNNHSSLRDLYLEVTDDFDSLRYRRGTGWRGMETRREVIRARHARAVEIEICEVDHGPVVSDVLPEYARTGEVVSLRWVGHEVTRELQAMLGYARARSAGEFRECLRDWGCPTFNFVFADRSGEIGYQLTGRIPLRREAARGYRPGEDPAHAWAGYIPFEGLPGFGNPPEGWLGSANNIVVTEDWPVPLSGTWPSDYRMQRLAQRLNQPGQVTPGDMARLQMDEVSPRAAEWTRPAVAALREAGVDDSLLDELEAWDHVYHLDSRPACVFESFFIFWSRALLARRFPAAMWTELFALTPGLAERLLAEDALGWFRSREDRRAALKEAWKEALQWLESRLGRDRSAWRWGEIHTLTLPHPLAVTPVLRDLLNRGPYPHGGTWNTLNNSAYDPSRPFETLIGVSFRLLVDVGGETRGVNAGGQSGHPGSPHYADQLPLWTRGEYHPLDLDGEVRGRTWLIRPE